MNSFWLCDEEFYWQKQQENVVFSDKKWRRKKQEGELATVLGEEDRTRDSANRGKYRGQFITSILQKRIAKANNFDD